MRYPVKAYKFKVEKLMNENARIGNCLEHPPVGTRDSHHMTMRLKQVEHEYRIKLLGNAPE